MRKKAGVAADAKGLGHLRSLRDRGRRGDPQGKGRVEDPFQLEGMNGLGLAGVELHGIIGYNVLAHYRMEIDLTRDKMIWTAGLRAQPRRSGWATARAAGGRPGASAAL